LIQALNQAGFNRIKKDHHPLSVREKELLKSLFSLKLPDRYEIMAFLLDTGEMENVSFVKQYLLKHLSSDWARILIPRLDTFGEQTSSDLDVIFCQLAGAQHHRQLLALLRSPRPEVVALASKRLIYWQGFREIESLIDMVESGSGQLPFIANNILKKISLLDFGNIKNITKPERKRTVQGWRSWWRSIHDDRCPGSWKENEIDHLIKELATSKDNASILSRLRYLTHKNFSDKQEARDFWVRYKTSWSPHGAWVTDLLGNNRWTIELAQAFLKNNATALDVVFMLDLLDPSQLRVCENILPLVRNLTLLDMGYSSTLDLEQRRKVIDRWRMTFLEGNLFDRRSF
jgi:hypothetical protein